MDHFQGDVALEGFAQSKVNGDHPAAAELFHDSEVTATLVDERVIFFGIYRFFGADGRMAEKGLHCATKMVSSAFFSLRMAGL